MALQKPKLAQIVLQRRMLDADMPRRFGAVAASALLGLFYLSPLQVTGFLALYYPCDLALMAALRRLAARPQSRLWLRLVEAAAFSNMSAYLIPAVLLWLEPGTTPRIVALLFVFGGMLSVMLVRAAFVQLTIANTLPLIGFVAFAGYLEWQTVPLGELAFLAICVALLTGYFIEPLRSTLRINRTLAEARDAALARVATQRRFLTTMSHELRTPLNGILGLAQSLSASHPGLGAEVIRDSARDMTAMVGDLLDNAAIEAGALRIKREPIGLADISRRLEERWAAAYQAKGLALRIDLSPDLPGRLMLDPLRMTQCLSNLLSNALRHTRQGGAVLVFFPHRLGLAASVTDSGPGLPVEMEEHLFQPFTALATETSDSGQSTGLGLSICRGLARAMGGDLVFERPAEGGSRFVMTLSAPRATAAAQEPIRSLAEKSEQVSGAQASGAHGGVILVVDDIATNRLVLRMLLAGLGWQVTEAASGQEAVDLTQSHGQDHFAAVLMDIRMPELSGFETLALMRRAGLTCPIIAVSADAAPEERAEALAYGFDGYLTKPVEAERLGDLLQQVDPAARL